MNETNELVRETLRQNQELIRALVDKNNAPRLPSIKLKDPPTYDGVRDAMVIDDWITAIENQKEFHDWDDAQAYRFAVVYLSGRAGQWIKRLKEQGNAPQDWVAFKEIFIQQYRPENADLFARDLFASCVQKSTVEAYVEEFQDVIHMLPELTDDEKCDRFMRGLSSKDIRAVIRNLPRQQRSLDCYFRTALSYEAARDPQYDALAKHLAIQQHIHSPNPTSNTNHIEIDDPMEINAINQFRRMRLNGGSSNVSSSGNSGGKVITCYYCNNVGHIKRNCNKLRREMDKLVNQAMNERKGGNGGKSSRRAQQLNVIESTDGSASGNGSKNDNIISNKDMNSSARYSDDNVPFKPDNTMDDCNKNTDDYEELHVVNDTITTSTVEVSDDGYAAAQHNLPIEARPINFQQDKKLVCNMKDASACVNDIKRFKTAEFNSLGVKTDLPLHRGTVEHVESHQPISVFTLVDTGASECYISPRLARMVFGEYQTGLNCEVQTACGSVDRIDEGFTFKLNLQGHQSIVSSFVYDSKFDIILGRSWLKTNYPEMDFKNDTMRMMEASTNRVHVIQPTYTKGVKDGGSVCNPQSLSYLINYHQASRWLRKKGSQAGLIIINDTDEIETMDLNVMDGEGVGSSGSHWVQDLLKEFPGVFKDKLNGLPPDRSSFKHIIDTQDAKPVNRPAFKMSPVELEELRKQLKELLELKLIQPSNSPWGAPVLFCRKKDGTLRMCIDYRALNQLTVKDTSPLPRIDECLDRLKGASYFTSLDLKSGYHQIRIRPKDVPKTGFNTRWGKWEFLCLPFGLSNGPPSFQKWMNELLGDYIDESALVYLDDVLIFSKNLEDHKKHVREILRKFEAEQLVVNKAKCNFGQRTLTFLGYEISEKGILPSREKVKAVQDWPVPTNVQQVRQFLGLSQHYRRFIRQFSSLAVPLTDLTRGTGPKKRVIEWTTACQKSFDTIKSKLTSAPLLQLPNMSLPFRIETDSSDYGIGCVLLQPSSQDPKEWHPVAFESKKLSTEEQKFPAQERELIGIVHALRTWRCYVDGCSAGYVVYSDHNPLVYFRKQKKPTPRLVRWISELELYSPVIMYKSGKTNVVADALSRIGSPSSSSETMEPKYLYAIWCKLAPGLKSDWPLLYTGDREEQVKDPDLKKLLQRQREHFVVKNNNVFRKVKHKNHDNEEVIKEVKFVPFVDRADLVSKYHEGFGHASFKNVYNMFHVRYWWPNMRTDIETWLSRCPSCQLCSKKNRSHQDVMHPMAVPHAFERWHIDFVGQLPTTPSGNKWLITAVDYTTNWPIAKALPVASKESVADFIYNEIVMKFGCPIEIVTDRGSNLTSELVEEYLKRIGVKHKLTSAFHPRTNGKVERYNGVIKSMLRKYVLGDITIWDQYVNPALWASRVRVHSTTGYSPFYLTYGREPHLPGDPLVPFVSYECLNNRTAIAYHTSRELTALGQHRAAAEARLKVRSEEDKLRWDAAMNQIEYEVGDLVMLTHEDKFGLEPTFKGPYVVTEVFEEFGTCRLETVAGQKLDALVHKDRLKHAKGDKPEQAWYDPTAARRKTKEITSSRSGMRTNYTVAAPTVSSRQDSTSDPSFSSAFTKTSISGTDCADLDQAPIVDEDSTMEGSEEKKMPSNLSVSVSADQHDNQQEHPIIIDDDMSSFSDDDDVQDTDIEDADGNHSEDESDEFVEAVDRMSEEERMENNFEQERDLLQRQKQAFEEDKVKVQQQQQALWEEQKAKEEELRKKEEELKKQEKEMAVELEKKKEEIDRNAKEIEIRKNNLSKNQHSSKNKLVIDKDEVIIDEGIDKKNNNTTVIKYQGDLLGSTTKEATTTNIDADMIEAPKKKSITSSTYFGTYFWNCTQMAFYFHYVC